MASVEDNHLQSLARLAPGSSSTHRADTEGNGPSDSPASLSEIDRARRAARAIRHVGQEFQGRNLPAFPDARTMPTQTASNPRARRSEAAPISPADLYPLRSFLETAGIGRSTLRRARERGVELTMLRVGRCKYVRGADGIAFLEAAATVEGAA